MWALRPTSPGQATLPAVQSDLHSGKAKPAALYHFISTLLVATLAGCGGAEESPLGKASREGPILREVAAEVGLGFHHFTGSAGEYLMCEIMGAGVGVFDYDDDGDLDVYLLQGTMIDPKKSLKDARFPVPARHWPGNRLFRNELIPTGELRFTDVTEQSGLGHEGYGMGVAVGDFDNDGYPDLYVTNFGPNVLYRNNGDGTFTDVTGDTGLDDPRWSTSASFVDYDRDGDLDLFFTNYIGFTLANNKECFDPAGARDYCTPNAYRPVPDRLFRNEGNGRFVDISREAGIGAAFGNGLGVTCADFNLDGWSDIYVANDGTDNQLWQNHGDGTFENVALMAGAAYNADGSPEAGMGVSAGDFDGDGDEDLFMTHLTLETNTLYLNNGSGNFHDATNQFGLGTVSFLFTGFGAEWWDYDNDGWLDLFIANGAVTIVETLRGEPYPFHQRNQLFRSREGKRFEEVSDLAGPALELSEVSRGAAFADFDQDGDVDVIVSNNNGPVRLFLNEVGSHKHWLQVQLEGVESNREGIGARVALLREGHEPMWRRTHRDGSYLSSSDVAVHFGLGDGVGITGIGVVWPNGKRELWRDIQPDHRIKLREGTGQLYLP